VKTDRHTHISELLERIGRLMTMEAHAEGLLPVHWEALRYLQRANRFSMTAAALTAYLGLTKGTVSQTLKALESKSLVKKRVNSNDRRSNYLSLTAKGRNLLRRDPLSESVYAIKQLSNKSQSALDTGLGAVLSARLASQNRQPFGQCRDCRYFAQHHPDGEPNYCLLLKETIAESEIESICFEQQPS